jgi:hypothetical protein
VLQEQGTHQLASRHVTAHIPRPQLWLQSMQPRGICRCCLVGLQGCHRLYVCAEWMHGWQRSVQMQH